jgi:hypothetical protein
MEDQHERAPAGGGGWKLLLVFIVPLLLIFLAEWLLNR